MRAIDLFVLWVLLTGLMLVVLSCATTDPAPKWQGYQLEFRDDR